MIVAHWGYHEPLVRNRATAQINLMTFFDGEEGVVMYNLAGIPLGGFIRIWTMGELRPWLKSYSKQRS